MDDYWAEQRRRKEEDEYVDESGEPEESPSAQCSFCKTREGGPPLRRGRLPKEEQHRSSGEGQEKEKEGEEMTVKWKVEVDIADLLIFQMALESLYAVAHECHAELERKEGKENPGDIMFHV